MSVNDQANKANTGSRHNVSLKERLERNLLWVVLVTWLAGVGSGFGAYKAFLEATRQVPVIKDSYIPKSELTGCILESDAIDEIDDLIQTGQDLMSGNDEDRMRVWLMQVLAFVHTLNLERNYEWQGQMVPAIEADIRYALSDPVIKFQVQKTLGVLRGFRSGLRARISP